MTTQSKEVAAQILRNDEAKHAQTIRDQTTRREKAETALAVSEEQFRLLVSSVRDYAIFLLNPEGIILTWNLGAQRIKGYAPDEIIGKHFSTFYPPEDLADGKTERELEIAILEGKYEEEGWRLRKDGNRFWASVVITALRDEQGVLRGFGKVTRDLTERRKAEEELRASEERFRSLVSGVKDYAIFLLDPAGHVVTWNAGAQRIKQYQAEEIIGQHFSRFYTPEDLAAGKTEMELKIATRTGKYEEEGWRVRKDGTRFWANVVITALFDDDGRLRGFSKVTRDITERRESERIRTIVDNVADAIITFDENGIVESFNPAAERIFSYPADLVVGGSVNKLMPDRDAASWSVFGDLEPRVHEVFVRRASGEVFPIDLAVRPFHFEGRKAYTAVVRDITERRQAEEQLRFYAQELKDKNAELARSNQELDDFAYIASHDLKEPLRGIHNYATFLIEDYASKLDDEGQSKLQTLSRLAQRMELLIDSLLEFSRVGRLEPSTVRTDLAVVQGVLSQLQITLELEKVVVRVPRPLPTIPCDRVRIGEVFQNLITNAMKYNDKPDKWIEIGYQDRDTGPTVFYVRDNGIGIPARHHDVVFRIFKRLHARDKFGGGTGAGLTIVKKIIERHGGRIWLESEAGQGTVFFFTLQPETS